MYSGAGVPPETMIAAALQGAPASSGGRFGLAATGSVIAAVLSSACCWLPLLLIAAGVSAGGISLAFAPLRPWFIALAVGCLAFGVWSNERRPRTADACRCETVPPRRRGWNRLMLAISALGVAAFTLFPRYVDTVFGQRAPVQASRTSREISFRVDGMTCTGCETGIETALRQLPGVVLADASYDNATVVVSLAPDASLGTDALIQAIARAGYSATSSDAPPKEKATASSPSVRVLRDDVAPLVTRFNAVSSQFQFLAILSPT